MKVYIISSSSGNDGAYSSKKKALKAIHAMGLHKLRGREVYGVDEDDDDAYIDELEVQ